MAVVEISHYDDPFFSIKRFSFLLAESITLVYPPEACRWAKWFHPLTAIEPVRLGTGAMI